MPHPGGVGKPERSGDDVANFKHRPSYLIQLPPLAEQTRIVVEVERRLSVVEELEAVVSANLQRATRLRRSFLRRSFTGSFTGPKFMQNVEA